MVTLFYVHIPKTAGTTIRVILERQYPRNDVFIVGADIQGGIREYRTGQKQYQAVFGHFQFGLHAGRPEAPNTYTYATLLRDPVERVLSLYYYILWSWNHYLNQAARARTLADFVSSGVTCTVDNAMVRQLCGNDTYTQSTEPGKDMVLPFGSVTREHLEQAQANLSEYFSIVGISERFSQALEQFRLKFGWRIPAVRDENVTAKWMRGSGWVKRPARATVAPNDVAIIEAHNKLDQELYDWVKGKFL